MMSKKIKTLLLFVVFSIFINYFQSTGPATISDLFEDITIKEVHILTDSSIDNLPKEMWLTKKEDFEEVMKIFKKYRYSRVLKYLNAPTANPAGEAIHLFIYYSDKGFDQQYIFIGNNNRVEFRNKSGLNVEYRITGNNQKLFDDLAGCLKSLSP